MALQRPCLICGRLTNTSHCPDHAPNTGRGSTRRWRVLRERVLERTGGRCERCGAPAREIHHVAPVWAGGGDSSPLLALCAACHLVHQRAADAAARDGRASSVTLT